MRIGLLLDRFDWPGGPAAQGPTLRRIAVEAERAGVASIWINDHFLQIPLFGEVTDPILESWTVLAHLAAVTRRVELGTLTTGGHHRHPGPLLKIVTTLDVLSGGRAWLGVGPAWNEREQLALGIPTYSWPERFARLEELLQVAHRAFAGDRSPYAGEHLRLAEPIFSPPPLRRPPILVGGAHERRVFPLVARYADACNLFEAGGLPMLRLKLDLLRRRCEEIGRDFATLRRTSFGPLHLTRTGAGDSQTVPAALERFATLAGEGFELAIVALADPLDPAAFELLAELVEALAPVAAAPR
ncbi:LLM class flavin-dependent oxidoreductase [Micromonospora sp. C28SCA-DRY-2]|uniref:LLM class flavin-dependent oxidoreductase n=1 Tax=Micromonospora sp. C28SCA-DRY-2 TaxID=3059522 RepID=UPI002676AFA6|nr:LLM class flavin-dependent oxidoreductase [Micromonospora sp. C28SCA-DRY-2]MDO3702934.1 LLM class flavin-dependent oxidoreductase [Micromonospora sp. C28SCA-DRY-2]